MRSVFHNFYTAFSSWENAKDAAREIARAGGNAVAVIARSDDQLQGIMTWPRDLDNPHDFSFYHERGGFHDQHGEFGLLVDCMELIHDDWRGHAGEIYVVSEILPAGYPEDWWIEL